MFSLRLKEESSVFNLDVHVFIAMSLLSEFCIVGMGHVSFLFKDVVT